MVARLFGYPGARVDGTNCTLLVSSLLLVKQFFQVLFEKTLGKKGRHTSHPVPIELAVSTERLLYMLLPLKTKQFCVHCLGMPTAVCS